jgi:hypothetical protein
MSFKISTGSDFIWGKNKNRERRVGYFYFFCMFTKTLFFFDDFVTHEGLPSFLITNLMQNLFAGKAQQ